MINKYFSIYGKQKIDIGTCDKYKHACASCEARLSPFWLLTRDRYGISKNPFLAVIHIIIGITVKISAL